MRIGIFDSGVGGLTVLKEALLCMPSAHYIYFGDTARFPYGAKSHQTLIKYSIENTLFLLQKQVDVILIACNTATSIALPFLEQHFSTPIMGIIEPAILEALETSENGRIGIIGSKALVHSHAYQSRLEGKKNITLHTQACPLLISLIEEDFRDPAIKNALLQHYLSPLQKEGIDTLILACTHFPLIYDDFRKVLGPNIRIIDPSRALAKATAASCKNLFPSSQTAIEYYVSDDPDRFKKLGEAFLGTPINNVELV